MGFLDFIFGKKDTEVSISYTVTTTSTFTEPADTKANKLAKEATKLKKEKKYKEALNKFLEAIKADGSEDFSVQLELRLPMYYQLLGRRDDAWGALQDLSHKYNKPSDQSRIYDKMRLHLQKEKSHMGAIAHGIFAFIMTTQGHQELVYSNLQILDEYKQRGIDPKVVNESLKMDIDRMKNNYSNKVVSDMLEPLLKKANMEDMKKPLMSGIMAIGNKIQNNRHRANYIEVHDICKAVFTKYGYLNRRSE